MPRLVFDQITVDLGSRAVRLILAGTIVFVFAAFGISVKESLAQADSLTRAVNHEPKVGLVLSGGSAKGLAHIGVLKVLEEEGIPIDVISGTSMGAIVGGLYAIGYSPNKLEEFATTLDWDALFTNKGLRRTQLLEVRKANKGILLSLPFEGREIKLPSGILSGQNASMKLSELTWPYQTVTDLSTLPIPFACVATNLRTGAAVSLKGVPLPEAIRASLSLPSIFSPVAIDGELFIDGGLSRNLPAIDATELGADFLIGIDVGAPVDSVSAQNPSFIDVMLSTTFFSAERADIEQRKLLDFLITPDISKLSRASFESSKEWIRRGEEAARAALPELRAKLDSFGVRRNASYRTSYSFSIEEVLVTSIEIVGVTDEKALDMIKNRLNLELPAVVGPERLQQAISRVHGTALFEQVAYSVIPITSPGKEQTAILQLIVTPIAVPDQIGFGLRYDSIYKAELLFNLALKNRRRLGSSTELRVRLGEQLEIDGTYFTRLGPRSRFSVGSSVGFSSAPMNVFIPGAYGERLGIDRNIPVFSLRLKSYRGRIFIGFSSSESVLAGFYGNAAHNRIRQIVAGPAPETADSLQSLPIGRVSDSQQEHVAAGVLWNIDSVDQIDFPSKGVRIVAEAEVGLSNSVPQISLVEQTERDRFDVGFYRRIFVDAEWFVPLASQVSLFGRISGVYGSGQSLPYSYYASVGGVNTVTVKTGTFLSAYGLAGQQRFGRKAYVGTVGVQIEVRHNIVLRVAGEVGDTTDLFSDDDKGQLGPVLYELIHEPAFFGFGLEVGLRTRLGPLQVVLSGGDELERPNVSVKFGFDF